MYHVFASHNLDILPSNFVVLFAANVDYAETSILLINTHSYPCIIVSTNRGRQRKQVHFIFYFSSLCVATVF